MLVKDSPKGSDSPRYYKPVDPKDSPKGYMDVKKEKCQKQGR